MPSPFKQVVATVALSFILSVPVGCPRRAGKKSVPSGAGTTIPVEQPQMIPDQVSTAGWEKAWTNLINDVEQGFTPAQPRLLAVEVDLVVVNPATN